MTALFIERLGIQVRRDPAKPTCCGPAGIRKHGDRLSAPGAHSDPKLVVATATAAARADLR